MTTANHTLILQAFADLAKAEAARIKAAESVRQALPEGTEVTWETRRLGEVYEQRGQVVWAGHAQNPGRVRVRNARTGKTTDISVAACYGFTVDGLRAP